MVCNIIPTINKNTDTKQISQLIKKEKSSNLLTLSDPTSALVWQYDFPVLLQCRKMSDTFLLRLFTRCRSLSDAFSSCSTDFSQQIAQVVLFLSLHVFLF
jgi:hypothetical protein